ncbi:MAG: serine hydrolase domain-containing protein [Kofleriaceae bacterium]
MRRAALSIALSIAVVAAYACAHWMQPPAPRSAIDEDMPEAPHGLVADPPGSIDELRARIARVLDREHIAGAAIALVGRDGPIYVGGIGVRDRATRAPMTGDTAFRVGSLSKSVIALGVMRLVDQGKLDVDRPLREIVPDLQIENPWEAVAPVTLAQCLEHTAGFDDLRFNEIFTDDEGLPVRDALAINPRSRRVRWRPGTRHAYSNVGYTVAARAIEVASGEPFDVYLRREILAPLGITDADFRRTDALAARLASGYMDDDEPIVFRTFAHRPAGALLASADDLAKLVRFWLVRGEGYPPIVSPAGLARIERSGTLPYPHLASDYGFANYGDVMHPVLSRGHDGGMPGFHASFRYFSSLGVGYALLLNSNYTFRGYFEIRALLFAYLTKGHTFPPPEPWQAVDHPGADYFSYESPRSEVFGFLERVRIGWHVADLGDHVHITAVEGWRFELVPAADGGYRNRQDCGSTVQFTTNRDGTPIMLTSFLYGEAATGWIAQLRYLALGLTLALLRFAPLWAAGTLAFGAVNRRRVMPSSLVLWPAVAGLSCFALSSLVGRAFFAGVIGLVHPVTVAICILTIVFAVASVAALVSTVRWALRPDRPSVLALLMPMVCGLAFSGLTIWLTANGWLGLRTWAW